MRLNRDAPLYCLSLILIFLISCDSGPAGVDEDLSIYRDPGRGPFEKVAAEDLVERCGLDPDLLASIDEQTLYPYAVVRYGLLCHAHYPEESGIGPDDLVENFSATKTLAAAVVGRAVTLSAELEYPLRDTDRMDAWVDDITFNPDSLVAHVLSMLGHNENIDYGEREFSYDALGFVELNRLSDVIDAVVAQDPGYFENVQDAGEFADRFLFEPLGMDQSDWSGEYFSVGWASNLLDMARLGLLLTHDGVYGQERILPEEWVYKMTHPSFEDSNTGYGYLTWLAAKARHKVPGYSEFINVPLGRCQPPALWQEYPHGLSESPDCGYQDLYSCKQEIDSGVFAAVGLNGQLIVGHPALDLVIVTKNAGRSAFISVPWDLVRPALVEHDPVYQGDVEAFCRDYAAGDYAPDLILQR